MIDSASHDNAIRVFYRQEVTTLIDFRTALDAIASVAASDDVDATFFCMRDVERLTQAATVIVNKIQKTQGDLYNSRIAEIFGNSAGYLGVQPPKVQMATVPEPLPLTPNFEWPHNNS